MPLRIGFVTTSFPRFRGDAAGSFVFDMAVAFRRLGFAVEAVVPEPSDTSDWSAGTPWLEGISVRPVPYARPASLQRLFFGGGVPDNLSADPATGLLIPAAVAALTAEVTRRIANWDAVISHWFAPSAFVVHAAGRLRRQTALPHLAVAHSGDVHLLSRPLLRPAARLLPRAADFLGFISEGVRERYLTQLGASAERVRPQTRIVPMGIDLDAVKPSRPRNEIRKALGLDGFTVLFLGRMVPIKGLPLLLDVLTNLPETTLIAAGDGPTKSTLTAQARNLGLRARFVGPVDVNRRAELLAACDALVLPSKTLPNGRCEGLPLVLTEAMAAGLPVIAANTGSTAELVQHDENGLLFPEGDRAALTECLRRLINDDALGKRLSAEGLRTAASRDRKKIATALLPMLGLQNHSTISSMC